MSLTHLNPSGLHTNPAFSQGVRIESGGLVVVGGQNGTDQRHVARLNIYLQAGGDVTAGYQAAAEVWGQHPTAISVLQVSAFARPDALVEIDALAVVP